MPSSLPGKVPSRMLQDTLKDMPRMTAESTHEAFHFPYWEVILYIRTIPCIIHLLSRPLSSSFSSLEWKKGVGPNCRTTETACHMQLCRNGSGPLTLRPNCVQFFVQFLFIRRHYEHPLLSAHLKKCILCV